MRARAGKQKGGDATAPQKRPSVLVLAAGASSRFHGTKQLARLGETTMVEMVVGAVPRTLVRETVIVLGYRASAVKRSLRGLAGVKFVVNAGYRAGLASSISSGILALARDTDGVLLLLADQPFVTKTMLARMIRLFESGSSTGKIVAAGYGRLVAPPVIFSRAYFPELEALRGDAGARSVIQKHQGALSVVKAMLSDVDTREDLEAAPRLLQP